MPAPAPLSVAAPLDLHAHTAGARPPLRLHADARTEGALLHLRYVLAGDLAQVRVPALLAAAPAGPTDGLWQRTCFELFVAAPSGAAYTEWNFAPSGTWAAYRFSAERERAADPAALPAPRLVCLADAGRLVLDAWVPRAALGASDADRPAMGLSAVIESTDGSLSYWALHHPGARPDFHQRAGWTARLPPSPSTSA